MRETFSKTTYTAWESINGLMVEFTTASGSIIKWKARAHLPGAMEEDM